MDEKERQRIEREIRSKAVSRARAKVGFRWHLTAFVMINLLLIAINLMFTPGFFWFLFPLMGWAIAIGFHAFAVFQGSGSTEDLIEQEVRREMERRGLA